MTRTAKRLLWFDAAAGTTAGTVMLVLHAQLASLYRLPPGLVLGMALANLAYASYSGPLARRASRQDAAPRWRVEALALANVAWGVFCWLCAFHTRREASWLGAGHLLLEGLMVGGLGVVEWKRVRPETFSAGGRR